MTLYQRFWFLSSWPLSEHWTQKPVVTEVFKIICTERANTTKVAVYLQLQGYEFGVKCIFWFISISGCQIFLPVLSSDI